MKVHPNKSAILIPLAALCLAACGTIDLSPAPAWTPSASHPPAIQTLTPTFAPSPTASAGPTASGTPTETATASPTFTSTPEARFELSLLGCNTSLDLSHQMGEVTNAYVVLRNRTPYGLTEVCATLGAPDEDRPHPHKTACIASLPTGYQVTFELTIDTGFREDTLIQIDVTTQEGIAAAFEPGRCPELGLPAWTSGNLANPIPIP